MDMVIYTPGTPRGHTSSGNSQRDDNAAGNLSNAIKMAFINYTKPEKKSECSKLYNEGDRVVVYSMKDQRPIFATVRSTGLVQRSGMPSVIFAGLESV